MRQFLMALSALIAVRAGGQPGAAAVRIERVPVGGADTVELALAGQATDRPPVLLVHGSPGAWRDLRGLLTHPTLTGLTQVAAIDRPGYGGSGTTAVTSLVEQARRIALALRQLGRPAIVVGHSLGGPIALALAAQHPALVHAVVSVAGSGDPALEEIRWYQHLGRSPLLRWMVPQALDVCNEEMFAQPDELVRLRQWLPAVQAPVTVLQGAADRLVPAANAAYLRRELCNTRVQVKLIPEMDHFIPFTHPQLVVDAVLPYLQEAPAPARAPSPVAPR